MTKSVNDLLYFIYRVLFLYLVFMLFRIGFYFYNADLVGKITWQELPSLLKGSLIYDSASIFYINLPFLFFSLIPFRFRAKKGYQTFLLWLFVAVNACGLAVNMADIFYYPFKFARLTMEDTHFLSNGNFGLLLWSFFRDYWYGFLAWAAIGFLLWFGFRKIGYRPTEIRNPLVYYASQTVILAVAGFFAVVMMRGGNISGATYPIKISDAGLYAEPAKTGLVTSNPFALIRTKSQDLSGFDFFPQEKAEKIFSPIHFPAHSSALRMDGQPNIVLVILESFGSSHIKALSGQFPEEAASYTPFLDSLIGEGYIFRNAYHNGNRSIDALPSLWTSIPTLKTSFLSLPQSTAPYHSLPHALREMGYSTAFMHGAIRQSMSFVAFGRSVGVESFVSQEDYEAVHGKGDFDGQWGIWDHKFLPFAAEKINTLPRPFFNTLFTLSSHHPFRLPEGFEGRYPEGNMPMHRMIGYSDEALRNFFDKLSGYDWYENTIFVIVADHSSGADNEKYRKIPYSFGIPILFYSPGGLIPVGSDERPAGHLDVMPTLLGLTGYEKPFFAFGRNLFADTTDSYTVNYMGAFNGISDSLIYIHNDRELTAVYNYRTDPYQHDNLLETVREDDPGILWLRAFLQQYYHRLRERNFVATEE